MTTDCRNGKTYDHCSYYGQSPAVLSHCWLADRKSICRGKISHGQSPKAGQTKTESSSRRRKISHRQSPKASQTKTESRRRKISRGQSPKASQIKTESRSSRRSRSRGSSSSSSPSLRKKVIQFPRTVSLRPKDAFISELSRAYTLPYHSGMTFLPSSTEASSGPNIEHLRINPKVIETFYRFLQHCASGCVVECRICNPDVAGSNLSLGYFAPRSAKVYSAFHPSGVGK